MSVITTDLLFRVRDEASLALNNLRGALGELSKVFLGFQGVDKLKDAAQTAARVEVLGTVLQVVGTNAGISTKSIDTMEKKVKALGITSASSREALTQMIQAGLISEQSYDKAVQLARSAQDLAPIAGVSSSEVFRDLIINIQQLDVEGLRYKGITTSLDEAQQKYAKSIGTVASALTQQQRQQALLNSVLEEAGKLQGTYEASMADVGKKVSSLERLHTELGTSVGNQLLPVYNALVDVYTKVLIKMDQVATASGKVNFSTFVQIGNGIRAAGDSMLETDSLGSKLTSTLGTLLQVWLAFKIPTAIVGFGRFLLGAELAATTLSASIMRFVGPIMALFNTAIVGAVGRLGLLRLAVVGLTSVMGLLASVFGGAFLGFEIGKVLSGFDAVRKAADVTVASVMLVFGTLVDGFLIEILLVKAMWNDLMVFMHLRTKDEGKAIKAQLDKDAEEIGNRFNQRLDMVKDAYNRGEEVVPEDTIQKAERLARAMRDTDLEVEKAADSIKDLKKAGSNITDLEAGRLETLQDKMADMEKTKKGLVKEYNTLIDNIQDAEIKKKVVDLPFELKLRDQEVKNQYGKVVKELDEAAKTLKLGEVTIKGNLEVGAEFGRALIAFGSIKKTFETPLKFTLESGKVLEVTQSFQAVYTAFEQLREQAKTPAELTFAIEAISPSIENLSVRLRAMKDQMVFDRQKAELDQLSGMFDGLNNHLNQVKDTLRLLKQVQEEVTADENKFKVALSDLGFPLYQISSGVISLYTRLKDNSEALSVSLTEAGRSAQQMLNISRAAYQTDLAQLQAISKQKEEVLKETYKGGYTESLRLISSMSELERDSAQKRIEIAKGYYQNLRQQQDQALERFKQAAERMRSLDKEIADVSIAREKDLRELRRGGMTQEEQYADKKREIFEELAKAETASNTGAFDKAKDSYKNAIALAKELANQAPDESERQSLIRTVANTYDELLSAQGRERDSARKTAQEQLEIYQSMTDELKKVASQLRDMAKDQVVRLSTVIDSSGVDQFTELVKKKFDELFQTPRRLTIEIDQDSVERVRSAITRTLSVITIPLNLINQSGGYASGGLISGPGSGTSDSILGFLSNGEFVVRASAVQKYGLGLLNAVNSERLLGFAGGGVVGAKEGISDPVVDKIQIDLRDGQDTVTLIAQRGTEKTLAKMLRGGRIK